MHKSKRPVMLIVLDGWGYSESTTYNAIHHANTPVWDELWAEQAHTLIECSGIAVGLPDQQMGNSEVGHMHIGAGRLIDQDFSRIGKDIASGEFMRNPVLRDACELAAARNSNVHLLGLLSPGGVHSHEDHIMALLDLAKSCGVRQTFCHAFLDGRDTPPRSARQSLQRVANHCAEIGNARIATIVGRYYAMDRNQNWDRTALAYEMIVDAKAKHYCTTAIEALELAYARGEDDEFVLPSVIEDKKNPRHKLADGDVVIFANFRSDRARQITLSLTANDGVGFERDRLPALSRYVTMTDYGDQFDLPVAYPAFELPNTFGAVVAANGYSQLRIAETEKYAHVTFFFNGGEERVFEGEERELIPSPDVATYDLKPEMSAPAVTDRLCAAIASGNFDAIICNYANADMVGHTGNFEATVRCIEVLDSCLGRVLESAARHGVDVLITADHGNAEQMRAAQNSDSPHTAHTSNLVPLVYVGREAELSGNGSLVDLAPTLLSLLGLEIPPEMTGRSLVKLADSAQDAA